MNGRSRRRVLRTHPAKVAAATQTAAQGRLDTAWQEWQVAEGARQAAYDVVALRRQLAAARTLAGDLDRIAAGTHDALDKHDLTATDAAAADAAAGEAKISVAAIERDLADAELAMRRALGVSPDESVPLDERLKLPMHLDVPDAGRILARPPGRASHRSRRTTPWLSSPGGDGSQRDSPGQFPKIGLGVVNTRDTGNFLTLGPALTIDLPVFDHNQGVIAGEKATRQQLFDEYHTRWFEARNDISRSVATVRAVDEQLRVIAGQLPVLQKLASADEAAAQTRQSGCRNVLRTAAVSLAACSERRT